MDNPAPENNEVFQDIEDIKSKLLEIEQKLNQLLERSQSEQSQQINNSIGLLKKGLRYVISLNIWFIFCSISNNLFLMSSIS